MRMIAFHILVFAAVGLLAVGADCVIQLGRLVMVDIRFAWHRVKDLWNRRHPPIACRFCLFGRTEPANDFSPFLNTTSSLSPAQNNAAGVC